MIRSRSTKPQHKWKLIVGAGFFCLLSACQSVEPSAIASISQNDISKVIESEVEAGEIPGGVVLIAHRDGQSVLASHGVASLEGGPALSDDTIFRFYSMTKPITCAAVLTLVDDGLISLNDPITDYIPEFASMMVVSNGELLPTETPITIKHLMTHTSGLSYAVLPGPAQAYYADANVFAINNRLSETLEQHITRLSEMPLVSKPGSIWNYGESMGVLGRLVEIVSGQSFAEFLNSNIFDPLSMTDTAFFVPPEKTGRFADLYYLPTGGEMTNITGEALYGGSYRKEPSLQYGGAGLVGTPKDYLRFARMLLNNGTLDGKKVLSKEAVHMMTSNQLSTELGSAPLASAGRGEGVGFGFCGLVTTGPRSDDYPGPLGEYGWGGWASTDFWIDPENQITGLVFTQVIPEEIGSVQLSRNVRELIYKR